MQVTRRSAMSLSLVALGMVAGCTADITPPPQAKSVAVGQAHLGQGEGPTLVPNGVPYRNPAYQHATGRAGLASLEARALLNRDGTTDLEVTSGVLDGAPAVDPIQKLQLKLLNPSNAVLHVENRNGLNTPTMSMVVPDATRHDVLQIQGNVEVPNVTSRNNRTGVVTITERVNRRPDLAATDIAAPSRAVVNTGVMFVGTIAELNGDLGARANCLFYIQGAEAARTDGVWVAEGDAVNCVMNYTFSAIGTYTVSMGAKAVWPGDWDYSNNSRSVTIEIYQPVQFLHGTATARQYEEWYTYDSQYWWQAGYPDNTNRTENRSFRNERHETSASFYGYSPNPLSFPATLSVRQTSGGVQHDALVASGSGTGNCLNAWSGNSTASVCSSDGATSVNVSRYSGRATYYTYNYVAGQDCYRVSYWWWSYWECNPWGPYTNTYYSSNESGGGFQLLGSDYRFEVNATGAASEIFKADVTVPLAPFSGQSGSPWYCQYGYQWQSCYQSSTTWSGKGGSAPF